MLSEQQKQEKKELKIWLDGYKAGIAWQKKQDKEPPLLRKIFDNEEVAILKGDK